MITNFFKTILTAALILLIGVGLFPVQAKAMSANWQKGISIYPANQTVYGSSDFRQSLSNYAQTGGNFFNFVVPYYQANKYSSDFYPGNSTPTDESLISGINYAKSLGLQTGIKIFAEISNGDWRAAIEASNNLAWFSNYGKIVTKYGQLGQQYGVEIITIGTEMIGMSIPSKNSNNTQGWLDIIANTRKVYSGKLTYGATHLGGQDDEKNLIQFWPQLDYIGITAYFQLADSDIGNPGVDYFKNVWNTINNEQIKPLYTKYNKPIIFAEVGYESINASYINPGDYTRDGPVNTELQATLYEALFSYFSNYDYIAGIHLWEWNSNPNTGGIGNKDFTPQNKPAQKVMESWFKFGSSPTKLSFQSTTTVPTTTPTLNQPVQVNNVIKNTSTSAGSSLVDIEIYNQQGQKVFQQYYENQGFTANESKNYNVTYTPTTTGTYTVKVGVFGSGWNPNYIWDDKAVEFNVTNQIVAPLKFTSTTTVPTTTPTLNQPVQVNNVIKNTSTSAGSSLVDIEIYNQQGQKVFQQYYENQGFTANESKNYNVTYTPTTTGTYTVKVGVFGSGWNPNYIWDDKAVEFNVTNQIVAPLKFTSTTTVPTTTPTLNQPVQVNNVIKNTSTSAGSSLVDIEIYNQQGQKVFQQYYENQGFTANESKNYNVTYTPTTTGTYTVKVGVFGSGWNPNYIWDDKAVEFRI